ncbi:MAG: hypothetical protein CVU72_07805 [Deltaproteobacteria bacterium HGW-Deltaproteobacteria-7]|nr:MAG: hypothetical protein CVU72_07805 [Deltaproteobacteria bacterium HGW-Deltaproteobacteria-7]
MNKEDRGLKRLLSSIEVQSRTTATIEALEGIRAYITDAKKWGDYSPEHLNRHLSHQIGEEKRKLEKANKETLGARTTLEIERVAGESRAINPAVVGQYIEEENIVKVSGIDRNGNITSIIVESKEPLGDALLKKLKRKIELSCKMPNTVDVLKGSQSGIWGLFGDMAVVSWTYAEKLEEYAARAKQDADQLASQLTLILIDIGLPHNTKVRYTMHKGGLAGDKPLANQWRSLFAQSVIKLEHMGQDE